MSENAWNRFNSKVVEDGDCMVWTGGLFANGYGQFTEGRRNGRSIKWAAHRYQWFRHYGPIPSGRFICHRCDNRRCVRMSHLFLGDQQSNMDDKKAKGRQARFPGSMNQSAKLNEDQVRTIRRRRSSGESPNALAFEYGISYNTVYLIANRRRWGHVR